MKAYYNRGRLTLVERQRINWLMHVIIFIGLISMFILGLWKMANAPSAPKASITICDTFYQTRDKQGNVIYENKDYFVGVK